MVFYKIMLKFFKVDYIYYQGVIIGKKQIELDVGVKWYYGRYYRREINKNKMVYWQVNDKMEYIFLYINIKIKILLYLKMFFYRIFLKVLGRLFLQ